MKAGVQLLGLSLLALLICGVFMLSSARGSTEPEAPFWQVLGGRLASGQTREFKGGNDTGKEAVLHATLGSTQVEIKCTSNSVLEGHLEGSATKHAGKAIGALELKSCTFFEKEGESYKEQTKCEVPNILSKKLAAKLYLEGTKAKEGTQATLLLEPKEATEGKAEIATVAVNGSGCTLKGSYLLEGKIAASLLPNNEEFTFLTLKLPSTAIATVWEPASEEGEVAVALDLDGAGATLEAEDKIELTTMERFGGGTAPVVGIEAPFTAVGGERLSAGKEKSILSEPITSSATWLQVIASTEVQTRCAKGKFTESALVGSEAQEAGKIKGAIEFSECKLFAKEGSSFVEQPKCEVSPISTKKLIGGLWLEGTKQTRGTNPVIVFEPESSTEGKRIIAEEVIKGSSCSYTVSKYNLTGSMTAAPFPQNVQQKVLTYKFEPIVNVWRPGRFEGSASPKLTHEEGEEVKFSVPVEAKLTNGEAFGMGIKPLC
jgi:hypothetical protein